MNKSPEAANLKKRTRKKFSHLMENNKFVFVLSLVIAFFVWAAVAMYKSPDESFTVYNVPIVINTENSIVAQRGYEKFWQSDDKIDVTIRGPRYLITSVTADDIIVTANLNTVDSAGISDLTLKVVLRENNQDITVSTMSKTSVEVYFDAVLEKQFDIQSDFDEISGHIADGYILDSVDLSPSTVLLKGPETEINKIKRVVANPRFDDELMFHTGALPVDLSFEGESAADTVSANKYVEIVGDADFYVNIGVYKNAELKPVVNFTGTPTGDVVVDINTETVLAKIDTSSAVDYTELEILKLDYSLLVSGSNNKYTVKASDIELPEGVVLNDTTFTFEINITVEATQ